MPFQFYCPPGHLLEGHESQMGTPGQCPMCGAMFVFPQIGGAPPQPPMPGGAYGGGPQYAPAPDPYAQMQAGPTGGFAPPAPVEPQSFRILCPKGHELQTPAEMLGTKAQCPYCNAVLDLKYENSVEYREEQDRIRRQQELQQRLREEAAGRFWMKIAIFIGVVATLAMIGGLAYVLTQ